MPGGRHDAVRRSYDAVAENYAASFGGELACKPLDRALLACLIEQAEHRAPIADIGSGPGHVSSWLASHGVTAVGIDLSAAMLAVGRHHGGGMCPDGRIRRSRRATRGHRYPR
jgi:2-polyprenyl-3-methyl-5-hydroxy-6-metoxy-1,4-benzoquinol methylase